ncbi:MAG: TonB-dependent hemoglobin/transferrin/lactoferrin family receptor [Acetobacteraceae bacterium]|nr:TonB-dependent hemoglobin/transferrin/lactoferrin family receptor [Acetobacteraceae bacterium]
MPGRPRLLFAAAPFALAAAAAEPARAQQSPASATTQAAPAPPPAAPRPAAPATALDAVTVTATRTPQPISSVPSTVTVIDAQQLERQGATRPQDIVRYEPGVQFSNQPLRSGGGNFVIRGIGGNRVLVLTDGVRMPDFPESNIGAGTFTRDFTDLESVRRVEIVRGPASALYGSDAIGGVVNYILKDPRDYLIGERTAYGAARFGFSGADQSYTGAVTGAAVAGSTEFMGQLVQRFGAELTPNGNLTPNPQSYTTTSFLARGLYRASDNDLLRLTGQYLLRQTDTSIWTDRATTPGFGGGPPTTIQNSNGEDDSKLGRLQFDYVRTAPVLFADSLEMHLAWNRLDRREQTTQQRFVGSANPWTTPPNRLRYSDTSQEQDLGSGDLVFRSAVPVFGVTQNLTYGASVVYTSTSRPRNRTETNLATGSSTSTVAGETYPNKNFPDTTTWQTGLYLQDDMTIGRFNIVGGVRLDWYSLTPHPDADFMRSAQTGLATQVQPIDEFAVSPKLGLTYNLTDIHSMYGQYARGFRAPPYDTANFGFRNLVFGYEILPNGNLKPEYVDSFEAGARGNYPGGSSWQVAAYYNRYTDFISSQVIGTVGGLQQYQYRNLGNVEIYGAEARGEWRFAEDFSLRAAAAYAHAEDLDLHQPVDGVPPFTVFAGLSWQAPEGRFEGLGAEANVTGAAAYTRTSSPGMFKAPGYAVLDLLVSYDFRRNFTLNAGLFNVTNTKYFLASDISGVAANNPLLDLYAQPGRYLAFNLTARY